MGDFNKICIPVIIALSSGSGTALAANTGLEEIIVTAEFRETSLQDTPLAITAINGDMLEARSQTNILDVAAQAPSVTLQPGGGTFGPALQAFIRGVGQDDFNLGYEPGVGLYVDDVYHSILTGSALDLIDIDRIEILRGPQGTLSGRNSIGGSMKIYSQKAQGDNSGHIAATYGSDNRTEFRGGYDLSLIPDQLFLRVSGVGKSEDGYVDRVDYGCENPNSGFRDHTGGAKNCIVGTQGGKSFVAIRGALRWLPTDNLEINLSLDNTSDSSESQPGQLVSIVPGSIPPVSLASNPGVFLDQSFVTDGQYKTYSTNDNPDSIAGAYAYEGVSQTDAWGFSGTIDWQINDHLSLKSISAYRESDTVFTNDTSASPIPFSITKDIVTSEQVSQELRLSGVAFDDAIDYTVGGFLIRADNRNRGSVDIHYIFPGFGHIINDPVEADSEAVFGHLVWHTNDKLNLTAGIRYTKESKVFTYSRKSLLGDGTTAIPTGLGVDGVVSKSSASNTDYHASIDYRLTDETMIYAQYSTGFKGGGPSPRPFNGNQVANTFAPETVDSYEIGLKTDMFDNRMRFNVAAFFSEYKDKQIVLFACPDSPCASPANAGDADIWGIELETNIVPMDGMLIDASLSYVDFEYTYLHPDINPLGLPNGSAIAMDSTIAFTPEWQFSIGAQHEFQLAGGSSLTPRIDASYKGDFFTDATNAPGSLIEAHWLLNARMTWRSPKEDWQAALEVTNLLDEFYYNGLVDLTAFAGTVTGNVAPPRRVAFTIKKYF